MCVRKWKQPARWRGVVARPSLQRGVGGHQPWPLRVERGGGRGGGGRGRGREKSGARRPRRPVSPRSVPAQTRPMPYPHTHARRHTPAAGEEGGEARRRGRGLPARVSPPSASAAREGARAKRECRRFFLLLFCFPLSRDPSLVRRHTLLTQNNLHTLSTHSPVRHRAHRHRRRHRLPPAPRHDRRPHPHHAARPRARVPRRQRAGLTPPVGGRRCF